MGIASNSICYDLHSHTIASDGELSPTELVKRAVNNAVDVLAITDHDSISGIEEAKNIILENELPIKLINGVELSTLWDAQDIHIIGLNIDVKNTSLLILLDDHKKYRIERAKNISKKLTHFGIFDAYEHAKKYANGGIISRAHFARYMVDSGVVKDIPTAFRYYLSKGKKAYVAPKWCSIEKAVSIIHLAGGQAVLAHPMRYDLPRIKLRNLFNEFKQAGGDAIEISQSGQTEIAQHSLENYALEYEFLGSQGSDFHRLSHYFDLGDIRPFSHNIKPIWHDWALFL